MKDLHTIEVQSRKTCYEYAEDYWIIDGIPVVEYLDDFVRKDGARLFLVQARCSA